MLGCLLLCMLAFGLLIASLASRNFQRMQDHRWARIKPSRFEWFRVNVGAWWQSTVDIIRGRH